MTIHTELKHQIGQYVRVEWKDMSIENNWELENAFRYGVLLGFDEKGHCIIRYFDGEGEQDTAPPEIVFLDDFFL